MPVNNISVLPMSSEPARDEAEMIRAAQADPLAFGELHRLYEGRIYRYLQTKTANGDDAADLTQQVFLKALDALPRYRPTGAPFAAWLFRIARNTATDYHRRRKATVPWELVPEAMHPVAGGDPEQEMIRLEASRRLRTLLARLEPEKRDMLILHFVSGLKLAEIALVVNKSPQAVQKAIARTLTALKEQYDEE